MESEWSQLELVHDLLAQSPSFFGAKVAPKWLRLGVVPVRVDTEKNCLLNKSARYVSGRLHACKCRKFKIAFKISVLSSQTTTLSFAFEIFITLNSVP